MGMKPNIIEVPVGTRLKDAERAIILRTLEHHDGNKTHAAITLGIERKTLQLKLQRYRREAA
jgi:DNA-binding NtrC family response regulator